ncbi:MAG: response regulator [Armatimonadetes bacterium]|nr:response regulator [Armatimonadota bacterium]
MSAGYVLLIDDNPFDLELTLNAFAEAWPAEIRAVEGGQAALELLFNPLGELPRLILLDLNMPGVDGFTVLTQLKSNTDLRVVPVAVLSTSSEERDRARAYQLGANSYLVKPPTYEDLLVMVRRLGAYWLEHNLPAYGQP